MRRDDAVGLWVAKRLWGMEMEGVEVVAVQTLVPELIPKVAEADLVIFVDARAGAGPVRWERVHPNNKLSALDHAFTPEGLLAWADELFGHAPEAWLVMVPAQDLSLGEGLSPRTYSAAARLVSRLQRYLSG
jgi:hydrogenase maturation protease